MPTLPNGQGQGPQQQGPQKRGGFQIGFSWLYLLLIAGIFLIGIVVSSLNYGIAELERKVVRWH